MGIVVPGTEYCDVPQDNSMINSVHVDDLALPTVSFISSKCSGLWN